MERYAKAAWAMVAYTVFVIAWGAVVRATLSGAGCGDHWPLCNGEVVPLAPSLETIIEFGHRLTSGLSLLFCVAFVVASRRVFERGHPARRAAVVALGFMVLEALIGAGLVLLKLVAENPDEARGYWAAAHVVNTFLLLGALTLHAHQAGGGAGLRLRGEPLLISALGVLLIVAATGAIAALGDTLFPATDLSSAVAADFDRQSHIFIRLRVLHPFFAVAGAGLCLWFGVRAAADSIRAGSSVIALCVAQVALGFLNVWLLAPIWLQLVHLALADALWIALLVCALELQARPMHQPRPVAAPVV